MKKILLVIVLLALQSTYSQISVRAGLSDQSGLLGVEYKKSDVSFILGFLGQLEATTRYLNLSESRPVYSLGGAYYFSPESNSIYLGAGIMFNGCVQSVSSAKYGDAINWGNYYMLLGGYKFTLYSKFDMKTGLGIMQPSVSALKTTLAIDLAVGYNF